ncbi:MAG: DUF5671 domain-containing protein [Patescibacteria group bacterium]
MDTITSSPLKATPRDVFLHLLSIGTLYASAVCLIALLFQYVNYFFPDPLQYYESVFQVLRRTIATVIVVFPVYVATAWYFQKESLKDPGRRDIKIRKWFVYLTLFISAVTVIVDLVILVHRFLGGELTPRFGLKILAVLLVATGLFWYYLWDLKRPVGALTKGMKTILRGMIMVIGAVIVGGFFLVGSPQKQRLIRFDTQRVSDLQTIQNEVITYWQQKGSLPQTLEELNNDISGYRTPLDPETNVAYEYHLKDTLTFELCATFKTTGDEEDARRSTKPMPYGSTPQNWNWAHGIGRACFTRTIDPEIYRIKQEGFIRPVPLTSPPPLTIPD